MIPYYARELLAAFVGGVLFLAFGIAAHEFTHVVVFDAYGCAASYGVGLTQFYVTPEAGCYAGLDAGRRAALGNLHLTVEIVGYQLVPIYLIVGASLGAHLHQRRRE